MTPSAQSPLVEIANFVSVAVSVSQAKVAVIFDLDSTLFCVSSRTQAVLRDLARHEEFVKNHSEAARILQNIEVWPTDWGIRSPLERSNLPASAELIRAVKSYWRRHFFSNGYLIHDQIYPYANEYVQSLVRLGADIIYLTGRNETLMREGTVKMLKRWCFPFPSESKLIMKPNDVHSDEGFKAGVLRDLIGAYDHVWFFENEPVIIHQVKESVPSVRVVFVNSVHSGRALPPKDMPTIGMSYAEGIVGVG